MPLYTYDCEDCGAVLEILHPVGRVRERCGLDCQLKGQGSFGQGMVKQALSAPNLSLSSNSSGGAPSQEEAALPAELRLEAMRREALSRVGGEVTESELDKLRDSGMTVYRRSGSRRWEKDGSGSEGPREIRGPEEEEA